MSEVEFSAEDLRASDFPTLLDLVESIKQLGDPLKAWQVTFLDSIDMRLRSDTPLSRQQLLALESLHSQKVGD